MKPATIRTAKARLRTPALVVVCGLSTVMYCPAQRHVADPSFNTVVSNPVFQTSHPLALIDEAHHNFHTESGTYRPLAALLRSDGYDVRSSKSVLNLKTLAGVSILIISGAASADATDAWSGPAFTAAECNAVQVFVNNGGALLLIADHAPDGAAARNLASRFDVHMGNGFVFDPQHSFDNAADPTVLEFSIANGLLPENAITKGRSDAERVEKVVAFTGQSLSLPARAMPLLKLSSTAVEASFTEMKELIALHPGDTIPVPKMGPPGVRSMKGRVQGLAMNWGAGRIAVFGEAAMFSAQIIEGENAATGTGTRRMGMNVKGSDDRQLVLNLLHWLSGLLR